MAAAGCQALRHASGGGGLPGPGLEALRPVAAASAAPGCIGRGPAGERPVCWLPSAAEGSLGGQPALRAAAGRAAWQSVRPAGCVTDTIIARLPQWTSGSLW